MGTVWSKWLRAVPHPDSLETKNTNDLRCLTPEPFACTVEFGPEASGRHKNTVDSHLHSLGSLTSAHPLGTSCIKDAELAS